MNRFEHSAKLMSRRVAVLLALVLIFSLAAPAALAVDNPAGTTIEMLEDDLDTNNGTIERNFGTVYVNNGVINENSSDGEPGHYGYVGENAANGTIGTNLGFIEINNGLVLVNDESLNENCGIVEQNTGCVDTNSEGAVINSNEYCVYDNKGTILRNELNGWVVNTTGTVEENYGAVMDAETDEITYGLQVFNADDTDGFVLLQVLDASVTKLSELFTRDGLIIKGYTNQEDVDYSGDEYIAYWAGTITLIWGTEGGEARVYTFTPVEGKANTYFAADAAMADFVRIMIDGATLAESDYTVTEENGGLTVALKDGVAPSGHHRVFIVLKDGAGCCSYTA